MKSLLFLFSWLAGSAIGESAALEKMLLLCPKPFKGSDNFIAQYLNANVASKVGSDGRAPSKEQFRSLLSTAASAIKNPTLMAYDLGGPEEKGQLALLEAAEEKKITPFGKRLSVESNGCRIDGSVWKKFGVLWLRPPCSPAVMLFQKSNADWKYVCIVEYIY